MATYTPNAGLQMPMWQDQQPVQFPYGNNSMLLNNSPYNNYIGNRVVANNQTLSMNQYLKCRPVSSKEEAIAFQIDLDGSLWVFTDLGNNKIYTKQVNNDGTATFNTYVLLQDDASCNTPQYVTKDEFNKVIQALMASIPQQTPAQENTSVNKLNF